MKKIIFILLFSIYGYSQEISYIKTLDTVYICFKEDNFHKKVIYTKDSFGFKQRTYSITFMENGQKESFIFFFMQYPNSERRDNKIKSDIRIVKKAYLRKHKEEIIGIEFFTKYGIMKSTYEAFANCKVIYLIDNSEKKKGKVTLYEVSKFSSHTMEE